MGRGWTKCLITTTVRTVGYINGQPFFFLIMKSLLIKLSHPSITSRINRIYQRLVLLWKYYNLTPLWNRISIKYYCLVLSTIAFFLFCFIFSFLGFFLWFFDHSLEFFYFQLSRLPIYLIIPGCEKKWLCTSFYHDEYSMEKRIRILA